MNELKIFGNSEFGEIRTVEIDGKPYFVASDVAKALGYVIPHKAVQTHCKGVLKWNIGVNTGVKADGSPAVQNVDMLVIPEGDIYRLVVKSQLPSAEKFENWVFDEVLPSIRKHGMYAKDELLNNPDLLISVAQELKTEREKNKALAEDNQRMKPKEIFADAVTTSKTSILIGELAKILNQNGYDTGEKRLFAWLRNNGYLIKRKGTDYNAPTQRSMGLGLFEVKETAVTHADGHVTVNKTTKVTGKGQQYFINKFLVEGNVAVPG